MKRYDRVLVALFGLLLLGHCASVSVPVTPYFDRKTDFSALRTYEWMPGTTVGSENPKVDNQGLDALVRQQVDKGLMAKGFSRNETQSPDFWVTYYVTVEDTSTRISMTTSQAYQCTTGDRPWLCDPGPVAGENQLRWRQGTLFLAIIQPETRKLLWKGQVMAGVSTESSPEKRAQRVTKAIRTLLDNFPPKK